MNIATHNSGTGESGGVLFSWFISPFSKCQNKTLIEQYEHGCRYFDFRVRWNKYREGWFFAHGLWESRDTFFEIAERLYEHVRGKRNEAFIMLTYEGECKEDEIIDFSELFEQRFPEHFIITTVNIKKPQWRTILTKFNLPHNNCYKVLDGNTWHTYLPIPWLWAKIYPQTYHPKNYNFVDFL